MGRSFSPPPGYFQDIKQIPPPETSPPMPIKNCFPNLYFSDPLYGIPPESRGRVL